MAAEYLVVDGQVAVFEAGQVAGFVAVQVVEVLEVAEFAGWPVESLPVVVEEFVVE